MSPNDNILAMNEVDPPNVRSVKRKRHPDPRMSPNVLMLDSRANVHIICIPSFLSRIKTCVDQWINTTGSQTKCTQRGDICDEMKPLPLTRSGYLYHPNGIGNIISLSLLSDTHRITMDTDVDNAFYVHNKHDGSYMKYTRCPRTNLYTYAIGGVEENNVLLHSTV